MTIEKFLNADLSLREVVEVNSKKYQYQGLINKFNDTDVFIYVNEENADDDDTILVHRNSLTGETTLAE